jgi:hypothetical protein
MVNTEVAGNRSKTGDTKSGLRVALIEESEVIGNRVGRWVKSAGIGKGEVNWESKGSTDSRNAADNVVPSTRGAIGGFNGDVDGADVLGSDGDGFR